jgi:hypothetical protein
MLLVWEADRESWGPVTTEKQLKGKHGAFQTMLLLPKEVEGFCCCCFIISKAIGFENQREAPKKCVSGAAGLPGILGPECTSYAAILHPMQLNTLNTLALSPFQSSAGPMLPRPSFLCNSDSLCPLKKLISFCLSLSPLGVSAGKDL